MFSQQLLDILNSNYDLDNVMGDNVNLTDRKEQNYRTKTLNRREQTSLSDNATLLIEVGVAFTVLAIVVLVFYFSQRKRVNVHRRRWLDSDMNINNYDDGQIYGTNALEDCQSVALDQDDCPPPYESVVQQLKQSQRKKDRNSAKRSHNLPKCQPNCRDESQHNTISNRNSEPLISAQLLNCISTSSNENSSFIENQQLPSTSSRDDYIADDECTISQKDSKDHFKVDVSGSQSSQPLVNQKGESETNEKCDIVPKKPVKYENEIAILDPSGLPSYDTAIKIQECGNM